MVFALCISLLCRGAELRINEVLFNPPGGHDLTDQYVELRGTPNLLLTNTFFIAIEGNTNGNPGTILNVFDLRGIRVGGNGFIVLLQSSNVYTANPDATLLQNSGSPGFGSGGSSSIHHKGKNGQAHFQGASITFLLVDSAKSPNAGDDIDADNDGVVDAPEALAWSIRDSVGVLDNDGPGDCAYGLINFRRDAPPGDGAAAPVGTIVPIDFTPSYVARIRNSTNSTELDWLAADKLTGAAPKWGLVSDKTAPASLGRGLLTSLGAPNFRAPRLPGVLLRSRAFPVEISEGAAGGHYSLSLNAPCRGGLLVSIDAPAGAEVSVDRGRTYGTNRVLKLSGGARRDVMVRALENASIDSPNRTLFIQHQVVFSGDALRYPTNETYVAPANMAVIDKDRVVLSEIKVNPPGPEDAPHEFIEVRGTPGAALNDVKIIAVAGDQNPDPGVATVIDLSGQRLGSNGLLLALATSSTVSTAPGTTVVRVPQLDQPGGALPNGSLTVLLVHSTNSIVDGTDLDAGNNGTLERLPRDAAILDSVGWRDGSGQGICYTPAVVSLPTDIPDAATRFRTNDAPLAAEAWFAGNLAGDNPESLVYDEHHVTTNYPPGAGLSPGIINNTAPRISPVRPYTVTIGDRSGPPIHFAISDTETSAAALQVTVHSSNPAVLPDTAITVGGSGVDRTITLDPVAVGYTTLTITVTDGLSTSERSIVVAISEDPRGGGRFHSGASDGSAAYAIDSRWMLIGDDENQVLRLYSRSNSGPAIAKFDLNPFLDLNDFYETGAPKEVDIEAVTHVGNRLYWIGSHSHAGDAEVRTNRARLFATDLAGKGTNISLTFVGHYDYLKADLLNWDAHNEHGKGAFYYGLVDSSLPGVDPKATNGSGFNIEGLAMAPASSTVAYVGMRAPLVPPTERVHALIVPVSNFAVLAAAGGPPGSARFAPPIELNLGGRGIRSLEGNGTNYLIVAGPPGLATGVPPSDFKLYTWSGRPGDQPQERSADLSGLNPEGIVSLPPLPWTSNSLVQLISDSGTTVYYGDDIQAKHLPVADFKKSRTDWVGLGRVVVPQPFIRSSSTTDGAALRITWHSFKGIRYRVQAKATLADRRWTDIPGDITATGSTTTKAVQPTPARNFFRILAMPARP